MASGKRAVFGIYESEPHADRAVETLTKSDFAISEVSFIVPVQPSAKEMRAGKSVNGNQRAADSKNPDAGFEGTLGLLGGFAAMSIPGIGPILSAGQLVNSLRGINPGGTSGELADALMLIGVQEVVANRYEGRLMEGKVLVSVHCDTPEEISQAKELMEGAGGQDITSTGEVFADTAKTAYKAVSGSNR